MRRIVTMLAVVAMIPAILVGAGADRAAAAQHSHTVGVVDTATGLWHLWDPLRGEVAFYYGDPGDAPFVGDWDCDGVETPGLYRASDAYVYLRDSNTQGNADVSFFFGDPGDLPLAGDFNGDGCDTVSLYRPSEGRVYVINELGAGDAGLGAADFSYVFGDPGDTPFVGDFDGDGVDTIGLHRETTGRVYFRNSHTQGNADFDFIYGNPADVIFAGDWDGDGADSVGIYRSGSAELYLRYTNTPGVADEVVIMDVTPGAGAPVAGALGRSGAVSFAAVGCGTPPDYTDTSFATLPTSPAPGTPSDAEAVLGMSFTRGRSCDRAVIALKDEPGFHSDTPANTVPEGVLVEVAGNRIHVEVTSIEWGAADNDFLADPYGFVVASNVPGNPDVYVDLLYSSYRSVRAWYLSDPARIVVDSIVAPTPDPLALGPVVGNRMHLRDPIEPTGLGAANPAYVIGYARPFEASDGAVLTDATTGAPVDATGWGCSFDDGPPGICVYTTSGAGPEWGEFRITLADLAPGTYRFELREESAEDGSLIGSVSDTFTITGPGSCSADGLLETVEAGLGADPGSITLSLGRCTAPYALVFALPTAPNLESEQMFMKEVAGEWTVLTFGTGIDCFTDTDFLPPELETACEVLGLR